MFRFRFGTRFVLLVVLVFGAGLGYWQYHLKRVWDRARVVNALLDCSTITSPRDFESVSFIRAANVMRRVEKRDAVAAMRTFLDMIEPEFPLQPQTDPWASLWKDDVLRIVVPLVFKRSDSTQRFPTRNWKGDQFNDPSYLLTDERWNFGVVEFSEGFPFNRDFHFTGGSRGGVLTEYLVDWAADHGKMKTGLLAPPNDLMDMADRYIDQFKPWRESDLLYKGCIRIQVINSIRDLVPEVAQF